MLAGAELVREWIELFCIPATRARTSVPRTIPDDNEQREPLSYWRSLDDIARGGDRWGRGRTSPQLRRSTQPRAV
jgi:hypothetical protein